MTAERWDKVKEIFTAALGKDPAARHSFVREASGDDSLVAAEVLSLLEQTEILGQPLPQNPFAPLQSHGDGLAAGAMLNGRYRIVRELSRGGFGVLYFASDQTLHERPVVVKLQLDGSNDDPWFDRKFADEIRALSLIDHPGVVGALDMGRTPEGKLFLVMQYVEGHTLRTVMRPEGMPLERAADLLRQIGLALAAAHSKNVWHRDLKPENIMLQTLPGGDEHVRLIDFGIATVADRAVEKGTSTRVTGSLAYMAPEQFLGKASARTDIYAMGVIAYEMLTGRKPFVADTYPNLCRQQQAGVRLKPSDLRPELPATVDKLVLAALSSDAGRRPSSPREFGDQLAYSLNPSAVEATAMRKPLRRIPPRLAWGGGIAVSAALAGLLIFQFRGRTGRDSSQKPQPAVTAVAPPEDAESIFWNSIKDGDSPELFRQYLARFPNGRFSAVARHKLEAPLPVKPPEPKPSKNPPRSSEPPAVKPAPGRERIPGAAELPPLRKALNPDEYIGPVRGEVHWAGSLDAGEAIVIQAGRVSRGTLKGGLPRVPVSVEIVTAGVITLEAPSRGNQWDRVVLRNDTGHLLADLVIRWNTQ